jgi:hypothetical protein
LRSNLKKRAERAIEVPRSARDFGARLGRRATASTIPSITGSFASAAAQEKGSSLIAWRRRLHVMLLRSSVVVEPCCQILLSEPRGRVGERPPHLLGFRLPLLGFRKPHDPASDFRLAGKPEGYWSAGLADISPSGSPKPGISLVSAARRQVTSACPARSVMLICSLVSLLLFSRFREFRPIPVRRNFLLWDCKVTPADCVCQERNAICCIPNNDGLDAGLRLKFSTQMTEREWQEFTGSAAFQMCQCAGDARSRQWKTGRRLLIGCGKVEISVDGLWEAAGWRGRWR